MQFSEFAATRVSPSYARLLACKILTQGDSALSLGDGNIVAAGSIGYLQISELSIGYLQISEFVRRMPFAVAMFDSQMRYLQASDRWCEDYHLVRDMVLGRSHYEVFPEIPDEWKKFHQRGLAGETIRHEVEMFQRQNGRRTWLRWEIQPWGVKASPEGIFIFSEDITAQKEAEQRSRDSESQFQGLFQNSNVAIANCRVLYENGVLADVVLLDVNPHFHTLLPLGNVEGRLVSELFPGIWQTDGELLGMCSKVAESGVPKRLETYVTTVGQWVAVSVFRSQPGCFTAVFDFVTKGKEMELELAREHARLEKIVASVPGGVYTYHIAPDGESSFSYMSQRCRDLLQRFRGTEGDATPLWHALHPDDVSRVVSTTEESARDLTAWQDEFRFLTPEGEESWWEGRSMPKRDADGGTTWYGVLMDVTERKRAQLALQRNREELAEAQLSLIQAEGAVARTISQELHDDVMQRLALLSIQIGLHARNPVPPQDVLPHLRSYQATLVEIADTIRRIAHHMHPSILEQYGLTSAIGILCSDFEGIGLRVEFRNSDVPEITDSEVAFCVYRVCQQCLRNAQQHAETGEVKVLLEGTPGELVLTVSDAGVGFPVGTQQAGLGLTSIRERVRLVRGTVEITSMPGEGTRVVVRVPLWRPN
jgi:PAS domain S-box-containing protein